MGTMNISLSSDAAGQSDALGEVLSEDSNKREVELAFFARIVRHIADLSAMQLKAASDYEQRSVEADVDAAMNRFRSPVFGQLARELEKSHPAEADFGEFGRYREPDR